MSLSTTGYLHEDYAESFREFGRPVYLPNCQGWLLARKIPHSEASDITGCYPLFCCRRWDLLHQDINEACRDGISLVLVTDPFCSEPPERIQDIFSEGLSKFKEHYVVDLEIIDRPLISRHHRNKLKKASASVCVERLAQPLNHLDEWCLLYQQLISRHDIRGTAAFSRSAFAMQLSVPGLHAFRAVADSETVGMVLWYEQGETAYYHLGAYNQRGYSLSASYAIFWEVFQYFRGRSRWASLGAGAGTTGNGSQGLDFFKQGWSSQTRPVYLGKHIIHPARYAALCRDQRGDAGAFFPAYRASENSRRNCA